MAAEGAAEGRALACGAPDPGDDAQPTTLAIATRATSSRPERERDAIMPTRRVVSRLGSPDLFRPRSTAARRECSTSAARA